MTIAKRAHDRLDFLLEDASAGRAHPSWLSHRMVRLPTSLQVRRLLRPPCGGRCRVDEMVADRFDSLVEAMRYCCSASMSTPAWRDKQTDPGVE